MAVQLGETVGIKLNTRGCVGGIDGAQYVSVGGRGDEKGVYHHANIQDTQVMTPPGMYIFPSLFFSETGGANKMKTVALKKVSILMAAFLERFPFYGGFLFWEGFHFIVAFFFVKASLCVLRAPRFR